MHITHFILNLTKYILWFCVGKLCLCSIHKSFFQLWASMNIASMTTVISKQLIRQHQIEFFFLCDTKYTILLYISWCRFFHHSSSMCTSLLFASGFYLIFVYHTPHMTLLLFFALVVYSSFFFLLISNEPQFGAQFWRNFSRFSCSSQIEISQLF